MLEDDFTSPIPDDPLQPTVFHQPWWLQAATNGDYEEVSVSKNGRVVARWPVVIRRKNYFQTMCEMPPLTHFLGPAVDLGARVGANRALLQVDLTLELIEKLPKTSGFFQVMHLATPEVLAFQHRSFRTSVCFTWEVDPEPAATMWSKMRDKTRNVIRRAEKYNTVSVMEQPEEFAKFYLSNIQKSSKISYYAEPEILRVCEAALARKKGRILAARRPDGKLDAAIFYVWDCRVAFYLMSSRSSDASNGAVSLLIWSAMKDCASRGLKFDFDGVGEHGSARFFIGFGGKVATRYTAFKFSRPHKAMDYISTCLPNTYLSLATRLLSGASPIRGQLHRPTSLPLPELPAQPGELGAVVL